MKTWIARIMVMLMSVTLALVPSSAYASSIYDTTYKNTAVLIQTGVSGCSNQDLTYTWPNYLNNDEFSGLKNSFDTATSQGRWGVSVSWGQVNVFWTEDTSLYLDWTDSVYGGGYAVMAKGNNVHRAEFSLAGNYYPKPCIPFVSSYSTDAGMNNVISDKYGYNKNLFVVTDYPNYPPGYDGMSITVAEPKAEYVALGDSFSSGEGNPTFEQGTNAVNVNECHRSPLAYPRLLQTELNLGSMVFAACSGATTADVIFGGSGAGNWGEGAQINALSSDTEVVTITTGGNDVGFAEFAKKCVSPMNLPGEDVCDEFTDIYSDVMDAIQNELPDGLEAAYEIVLDEAPNAEVYIIGYPILAPWMDTTDPFDQDCGGLYDQFPNNWGDARAAHDVVTALNTAIQDAVSVISLQESTTRLHYVDVTNGSFNGHDLCQSDSYFYGMVYNHPEYSIHPNSSGHTAYTDDIVSYIN